MLSDHLTLSAHDDIFSRNTEFALNFTYYYVFITESEKLTIVNVFLTCIFACHLSVLSHCVLGKYRVYLQCLSTNTCNYWLQLCIMLCTLIVLVLIFFMIFIYEIVFYIALILLSTLIRGNCFGFNTRKSKQPYRYTMYCRNYCITHYVILNCRSRKKYVTNIPPSWNKNRKK